MACSSAMESASSLVGKLVVKVGKKALWSVGRLHPSTHSREAVIQQVRESLSSAVDGKIEEKEIVIWGGSGTAGRREISDENDFQEFMKETAACELQEGAMPHFTAEVPDRKDVSVLEEEGEVKALSWSLALKGLLSSDSKEGHGINSGIDEEDEKEGWSEIQVLQPNTSKTNACSSNYYLPNNINSNNLETCHDEKCLGRGVVDEITQNPVPIPLHPPLLTWARETYTHYEFPSHYKGNVSLDNEDMHKPVLTGLDSDGVQAVPIHMFFPTRFTSLEDIASCIQSETVLECHDEPPGTFGLSNINELQNTWISIDGVSGLTDRILEHIKTNTHSLYAYTAPTRYIDRIKQEMESKVSRLQNGWTLPYTQVNFYHKQQLVTSSSFPNSPSSSPDGIPPPLPADSDIFTTFAGKMAFRGALAWVASTVGLAVSRRCVLVALGYVSESAIPSILAAVELPAFAGICVIMGVVCAIYVVAEVAYKAYKTYNPNEYFEILKVDGDDGSDKIVTFTWIAKNGSRVAAPV